MTSLIPINALEQGLEQLGLNASAQGLMNYLLLLEKWNRAYNLTAIRDINRMITLHVLDSLAIAPFIKGQRLLDVGSGAGLPGIPLAMIYPDKLITLLDSNGKKTRFMQEAKRVLKLDNVDIIQTRAEDWHPTHAFDTITSRAFSDLAQMLHWTKHLITNHGQWLAMKGRSPDTELEALDFPWQVKTYHVPGLDGERCCVIIDNSATSIKE